MQFLKLYYFPKSFLSLIWGAGIRGKWNAILVLLFFFPIITFSQTNFQRAEEYFKQEKFTQAKPIFEAHLKQNPKDKATSEYLGDIAAYEKDWDVAISYYCFLVEEDRKNANYHYKYGGALGMKAISVSRLRALTYVAEIKSELELAAKLDPNHIEARWALIEYYIQLPAILGGSENKAIYYAEELFQISPVDGYLAKGHIAEYFDNLKNAEIYYKKAIDVGGSLHAYEKLISFYEKNNQPEKAIKIAANSLKNQTRNKSLSDTPDFYEANKRMGIENSEFYPDRN